MSSLTMISIHDHIGCQSLILPIISTALQVTTLVSALSKSATAHPHADIMLAHKRRKDATDLHLSKAGFQVQPVVQEVHACISCSGHGEGNSDQYTLLRKFPSISVFRLHLKPLAVKNVTDQ